jgi:hypothetical protein
MTLPELTSKAKTYLEWHVPAERKAQAKEEIHEFLAWLLQRES